MTRVSDMIVITVMLIDFFVTLISLCWYFNDTQISHMSLMWRNVKRNIIELRRYRVWTSRMYRASNWTSRFTWTPDAASFLNDQSCEIDTYSLLSVPLFTRETKCLKNVYNTSAMIVTISTRLCCNYFYQHEREVHPRRGHEGPEGE
jgi:hypothetical protein